MVELRRRPPAPSEAVRHDFCNEIKKLAGPTPHTARSQYLPGEKFLGSQGPWSGAVGNLWSEVQSSSPGPRHRGVGREQLELIKRGH